MKCLSNDKIIKYVEGELNGVEYSIVRDHFLSCEKCKESMEEFALIESELEKPLMIEPPDEIELKVMKKLFPRFSHVASVVSLVSASFLFLIAGIYVYFDFANDSMIKAFQMTTDKASSLISGIVRFVTTIFTGLFTIFKAVNAILEVLLDIKIGVGVTGTFFVLLMVGITYLLYSKFYVKINNSGKIDE